MKRRVLCIGVKLVQEYPVKQEKVFYAISGVCVDLSPMTYDGNLNLTFVVTVVVVVYPLPLLVGGSCCDSFPAFVFLFLVDIGRGLPGRDHECVNGLPSD